VKVILLVGYDKTMYMRINEKIDSHITEIRQAFRRSVPFLKDFWEPMLVNVRVVLLVGRRDSIHNGYNRINEKIGSHITEIRQAFRRSVPFLKDFWEPMSVNVRVVLLVGYDTTLYILCRVWNS
jgi:hypothetical protein